MKKAVSKISKILFVLTMIFSMSFAQISNIEAWDNTVPHEFTKVKKNIRNGGEIKYQA